MWGEQLLLAARSQATVIRFFLLPLRVARSGRFGRDAKSKTLENKSAHQQPGNHPRKKQEIKHARTQAKPQVTSAEMVSIVSIAVRLITQPLLTSFVIFMRSIHTMVTTVAILINTSIIIALRIEKCGRRWVFFTYTY